MALLSGSEQEPGMRDHGWLVRLTDLVSCTPRGVATMNMSLTLLFDKKIDIVQRGEPFWLGRTYAQQGSENGSRRPLYRHPEARSWAVRQAFT